jgi:hypothetical protein
MTIKPRNFVIGYMLVSALVTGYIFVSSGASGLGLGVMAFIAFMALLTIIGVMWLGSQENTDAHAEKSRATSAWKEREQRVNAARQALVVVADGGEVASSTPTTQKPVAKPRLRVRQPAPTKVANNTVFWAQICAFFYQFPILHAVMCVRHCTSSFYR